MVCPYCGETKSLLDYIRETGKLNKGVSGGLIQTDFLTSYECYSCNTCGAQWKIRRN